MKYAVAFKKLGLSEGVLIVQNAMGKYVIQIYLQRLLFNSLFIYDIDIMSKR